MPEAKPFHAEHYLTKIPRRARMADGTWTTLEADYLEVKYRLLWLRTEHPDAQIDTELVDHQEGSAVFRARVSLPDRLDGAGTLLARGGSSTGWGSETVGDFEDYLEKAETKALGRALAALGFGSQFCEDFDFEQADTRQGGRLRVVDAPVPARQNSQPARQNGQGGARPQGPSDRNGAAASPPATEAQVKAIYAIGRGSLAMDEEELDERCRARYQHPPKELNRRQASEFIDALKQSAP